MNTESLPNGRIYRYYIHPGDKDTNDALAPFFGESGFKKCADGKERFLFDTQDYNLIDYLQRSQKGQNWNFIVYIQEGCGKIRRWPFNAAKKRKPQQRQRTSI